MSLDAAWARRWIELSAADIAEQRDYLVDLDRAIRAVSYTHLTLPTILLV